jgi:hypothetical protein
MDIHVDERTVQILSHFDFQNDVAGLALFIPEKFPAPFILLLNFPEMEKCL